MPSVLTAVVERAEQSEPVRSVRCMSHHGDEQISAAISWEVTRAWGWLRGKARTYAAGLLVAALGTVGLVVWRRPNLLVALASLAFCLFALIVALVCLGLRKRAQAELVEALREVEQLKRMNQLGRRSHLMLEESLGHVLLAWTGSTLSVTALERTMPRNNIVKAAVQALQSRGTLARHSLDGVHGMIHRANAALVKLEEEIGPDKVEQQLIVSFTTRGDRTVELEEPHRDA